MTTRPTDLAAQDMADSSRYTFEEMVVTAVRGSNVSNLSASNSIEVIDSEYWLRRNVQSLTEVLISAAGVDIRDYGGLSGAKLPSLRGSTSQQVVVMRNGVRLNNPAHGLADLSLVDLENADRIEIYRGGASSIYGADAVGGVINIIMKDYSSRETIHGSVFGSVSSFSHYVGRLSLMVPVGAWYASSSYRREFQPDSSFDVIEPRSGTTIRRVNTGMALNALSTQIVRAENRRKISINANWMSRQSEIPGTILNNTSQLSNERQHDRVWSFNPQGEWNFSDEGRLSGSVAISSSQITYRADLPFIDSKTRTRTISFDGTGQWRLARWNLLHAGYGFANHSATVTSSEGISEPSVVYRFDTPSVFQHSFFVVEELAWSVRSPMADAIRVDPSVRIDWYATYGRAVSPKMGISFIKRRRHWYQTIRASAGRNFRAPTLNERFWVGDGARGNPDIKAERSQSLDAGLVVGRASKGISWQFEANAYRIETRNQIVWLLTNPVTPVNLSQTLATGYECIGRFSLDSTWILGASFTRNRAVDRSDRDRTYRTVNTPLYAWKYSASYAWRSFSVHASTRYLSERFVDQQNTVVMSPYWISDIGLEVSWKTKRIETNVFLDVKNVLNTAYETMRLYPGTAREIVVSARISR